MITLPRSLLQDISLVTLCTTLPAADTSLLMGAVPATLTTQGTLDNDMLDNILVTPPLGTVKGCSPMLGIDTLDNC